jgi:hypothetical protein
MLIVAESQELLLIRVYAQTEALRPGAKPLAGDPLASGIVISGLKMLAKVPSGVEEISLCLMCQHETEKSTGVRVWQD